MEVVEITENCFAFVMSLKGYVYTDCCIYDPDNNVIAFKHFVCDSVKYYGLIKK